ncbi:hypothetical protein KIN20_022427 [Parelaphostrongylus tenuis]|uniref:Uncharacterized protein n=1 Tax=Parelaphostrongylus tenuis TaxID=148309 RepID=A0AAD5MQ69_PARTN|nr:hypothetical protein KIN20_022427 [Parelaphostrongylus tenuis]
MDGEDETDGVGDSAQTRNKDLNDVQFKTEDAAAQSAPKIDSNTRRSDNGGNK